MAVLNVELRIALGAIDMFDALAVAIREIVSGILLGQAKRCLLLKKKGVLPSGPQR